MAIKDWKKNDEWTYIRKEPVGTTIRISPLKSGFMVTTAFRYPAGRTPDRRWFKTKEKALKFARAYMRKH